MFESRDTANPTLVTELLMTLLEAHGQRIAPSLIQKRVRDDVCWASGAENPWRRSPFWLVARIGLTRYFHNLHDPEMGTSLLKILLSQLLATLVDEGIDYLGPEVLKFLNAKLARRLVKLEDTLCKSLINDSDLCGTIFWNLKPGLLKTLDVSNKKIVLQRNSFKFRHQKRIPILPRRADQSHLKLSLLQSQSYLQMVFYWRPDYSQPDTSAPLYRILSSQASLSTTAQYQEFASSHSELASLERKTKDLCISDDAVVENPNILCEALADSITGYLEKFLKTCGMNPELKSTMILDIMDLWTSMDRCATQAFPLLLDYDPGITAAILDVLLLMHYKDFSRLQRIQSYLHNRAAARKHDNMTIFRDPTPGCFAEQYFDHSIESTKLQSILEEIQAEAEEAKQAKFSEWEIKSNEYRSLQENIQQSNCLYMIEDDRKVHDDKGCTRCYLNRKAWRMRIDIHEHPLSVEPVHLKAVIFEIGAPAAFRRYRDITWKVLLSSLCLCQSVSLLLRLATDPFVR